MDPDCSPKQKCEEVIVNCNSLKIELAYGGTSRSVMINKPEALKVSDLQESVAEQIKVPIDDQRLYFKGQRLHQCPASLLSDVGVFNNSLVKLVPSKIPSE
ncbi:hypothetical protein GJ496_010669 [Pomphorhynchus laevis]|nr:hypothetical protein GJ496_010669 [Pomphorhynchus laevis]